MKLDTSLKGEFLSLLGCRLPDTIDFLSTEALDGVFQEMTSKLCNTRIQEFISWIKQEAAVSKGLATAVEQNLRASLLTQHTQLRSKLTTSE